MNTVRNDFSTIRFHFIKLKGGEEQIPTFYKKQLNSKFHEEDVFSIEWYNTTGKWIFKYVINDKVTIVDSTMTDVQVEFLINEYIDKLDQSYWKFIITGQDFKAKSMQNMRKLFKYNK
jgi:hypothetical protein